MHHLRILGTIDLRDSAGREVRPVLHQPKRLALLVWLALEAGDRFVRRDTLLALFWPELDQSKARAALRRAIYFLRQALGDPIIEGRGDEELRLGVDQLWCDAVECRTVLKQGQHEAALALYGGDLLTGFYIASAPDAEEWLDHERRSLRERIGAIRPATPLAAIAPPPMAGIVVAVAPFTVHAAESLAYLSEGLMDLFGAALDGVGNYRTLDPRTSPATATHFLAGTVVAAGGRLRLLVQLRDGTDRVVARAETAEAEEAGLFELVDDAVRQLVVAPAGGASSRMTRLASQTTGSWPALRAWLAGEHEFRLGRYLPALEAYQRAAAADPTFALAHYRAAAAAAALALIGPARAASDRAMPHRSRLTDRDRLLVEAQHAWLHGAVDDAERRYAAVIASHPDDLEAWSLLGDLLFHHNPYRGQSIRAARPALEQALRLDPGHLPSLTKLARLDALERRPDVLARRVERLVALSPAGDRALGARLLHAVAVADEPARHRLLAELQSAPALALAIGFTDVALYGGDAAAAADVGGELLQVIRAPELQAAGVLALAHLAAGRHRLDEARTLLQQGMALDHAWGLTTRGFLHALPFLPWPTDEIRQTLEELRGWNPAAARPSVSLPLALHNDLQPHARCWAMGLLAARLGEIADVVEALEALGELPTGPEHAVLVQRLERSLGAELRVLRGDVQGALDTLSGMPGDIWFQYAVASPLYTGVFERWRRGMLLRELGRAAEADGWLSSLAERSPWELAFLRNRGG